MCIFSHHCHFQLWLDRVANPVEMGDNYHVESKQNPFISIHFPRIIYISSLIFSLIDMWNDRSVQISSILCKSKMEDETCQLVMNTIRMYHNSNVISGGKKEDAFCTKWIHPYRWKYVGRMFWYHLECVNAYQISIGESIR